MVSLSGSKCTWETMKFMTHKVGLVYELNFKCNCNAGVLTVCNNSFIFQLILGNSCGCVFNIAKLKCLKWKDISCSVSLVGKHVHGLPLKIIIINAEMKKKGVKWCLLYTNTEVQSQYEGQMYKYRCVGSISQIREPDLKVIVSKSPFIKRGWEKLGLFP